MENRRGRQKGNHFSGRYPAIEGVYVPFMHGSDFRVQSGNELSATVRRRIIKNLDDAPYPDHPVVPYASIIHDRVNIEVSRGCSMGCRFCQAGMIYRPVRERSPEKVLELTEKSLKNTGYEEAAFTSLSAGDYSCLLQVVREFNKRFSKDRVALSLPSLRVASINRALLREIRTVRKTGFTIAPEAGTERLRKVINKDFTGADYERALNTLFEEGWLNLKLYFMIGLPTETDEDIEGIHSNGASGHQDRKAVYEKVCQYNSQVFPRLFPSLTRRFNGTGKALLMSLKGKRDI